MDRNTGQFNQEVKRNGTIVLAVVIAVNVGYWGWRWATHEDYEGCIKQAAKAANGVSRAYFDLRKICDDRQTERMIAAMPAPKEDSAQPSEKLKLVTDQEILRKLNR